MARKSKLIHLTNTVKNIVFPLISAMLIVCSCHQRQQPTTKTIKLPAPAKAPEVKHDAPKPVFGYRFIIEGDFNGDGKRETLTEHYISDIDHKETNKFFESDTISYDTQVDLIQQRKTHTFLICSNKNIKPMDMDDQGRSFGCAYVKNEGDLNGDGTDEVSYVTNFADWSNINSWVIMTYKAGHWQTLYAFIMWDWQLPDLPQTYNQTGMFGRETMYVNTIDTAANRTITQDLHNFKGLVKKVANNKIRIIHMGDDAFMDTIVVDIRKWRAPKR